MTIFGKRLVKQLTMKTYGTFTLIAILGLLFLSIFANIYEFPEDEAAGNINADGTLVLSVIYFLISLLAVIYGIRNGLRKNFFLAYLIYLIGAFSFLRLLYILIFYY